MSAINADYNATDSEMDCECRALGTILAYPQIAKPVMGYLAKQMFSVPFHRAVWSLVDSDFECGYADAALDMWGYVAKLEQHEDFDKFGAETCIQDLIAAASPDTFPADILTLSFRLDRLTLDLQSIPRNKTLQ